MQPSSRRHFIRTASHVLAGAAIGPWLGGTGAARAAGSDGAPPGVSGASYARGTPDYELQRMGAVWQAIKPPRHPELIVQARSEADIIEVLRYARARQLPVAVKGGGHNYTATYLRDRGVLLDVSSLREVAIDVTNATVRAQPGIRAAELCKQLQGEGLAFPLAHSAGVPIGGYLLGGGMGWNGESWGRMACFRVRAVDVITAAGERLTVNERSHPELYWAARGAGPAFCAVATRFHLAAFPYPRGLRAMSYAFPIEMSPTVTQWLHTLAMRKLPNLELTLALEQEADTKQCSVSIACFAATEAEGNAILDAVARSAPSVDAVTRPIQRAVTFDDLYEGSRTGAPRRVATDNIWTQRPLEAVDTLVSNYVRAPSPYTVAVVNFQANRGPLPSAACATTGSAYLFWVAAWDRTDEDAVNFRWVDTTTKHLQPLATYCYVNEADLERRPLRVRQCFPAATRARLRSVAARYDPTGLLPPAFDLEPKDT